MELFLSCFGKVSPPGKMPSKDYLLKELLLLSVGLMALLLLPKTSALTKPVFAVMESLSGIEPGNMEVSPCHPVPHTPTVLKLLQKPDSTSTLTMACLHALTQQLCSPPMFNSLVSLPAAMKLPMPELLSLCLPRVSNSTPTELEESQLSSLTVRSRTESADLTVSPSPPLENSRRVIS